MGYIRRGVSVLMTLCDANMFIFKKKIHGSFSLPPCLWRSKRLCKTLLANPKLIIRLFKMDKK